MSRQARWTVVAVTLVVVLALLSCQALMRTATKLYPQRYKPQGDPADLKASFLGADESRAHVTVKLTRIGSGFEQPTTLAFVPGEKDTALVLQKTGALKWFDPATGDGGDLVTVNVNTASEQGLLGLAFHPRFVENRRFFLNYTTEKDGKDVSRVEEWSAGPAPVRSAKVKPVRVVLEVEQPYANHNGGHLTFGPDGKLYVGFGDGGFKNDPHKAGQDLSTWLGKMLRLDVDALEAGGSPVPADNPFVSKTGARPEIWAYGLRNPWRYAFAPDGRLVVADVGQDAWEEVGFAAKGDNLGWNAREGRHCFEPKEGCATTGLRDPFFEYGHDEGQSVTGGVVVTGARVPALTGKYVFGDFILGKLWALTLPADGDGALVQPASLGKWPVLPVSFALDGEGDLYVLDFAGAVLRVAPP